MSDLIVELREMAGRGMIDLRGPATDRRFFGAAREALGLDLPKTPRTAISWGEVKALWLSPDQWLILCPLAKTAELLAALNRGLAAMHAMVTDVSSMRQVFRIEGDLARHVLLKGSSLDLLSDEYPPGTIRRARFAEIAALLHVVSEDPDVIDLYVFRSFAAHIRTWFAVNARAAATVTQFGAQEPPGV